MGAAKGSAYDDGMFGIPIIFDPPCAFLADGSKAQLRARAGVFDGLLALGDGGVAVDVGMPRGQPQRVSSLPCGLAVEAMGFALGPVDDLFAWHYVLARSLLRAAWTIFSSSVVVRAS